MQPYQERVITEKQELDTKIEKLTTFFSTTTFNALSVIDRTMLKAQHSVMQQYSKILEERIARFTKE